MMKNYYGTACQESQKTFTETAPDFWIWVVENMLKSDSRFIKTHKNVPSTDFEVKIKQLILVNKKGEGQKYDFFTKKNMVFLKCKLRFHIPKVFIAISNC